MAGANPFVYGEVVTATAFADREQERERLTNDLAEGQKVFLISPRRYGKSSLIRDVMKGLAGRGVLTAEVTVAASSSYVGFLEAYARALLSAETPPSGLRRWTTELFKTGAARAAVRRRSRRDCRASRSLSRPCGRRATRRGWPQKCLRSPAKIAARGGSAWRSPSTSSRPSRPSTATTVEHALRAAVQEQRAVGYVFAGSEPSLMERMLTPERPFYKAGPVVRLGKIDERVFADFIEERFAASGIRADDGLGAAIVELAENVPYDVQRLAHETWDDVRAAGRKTRGPRGSAPDARPPAQRTAHDVRGVLAAADAGAARGSAGDRAGERARAALGRSPPAPSAAGGVERAVCTGGAGPPGHRHEGSGALPGQ